MDRLNHGYSRVVKISETTEEFLQKYGIEKSEIPEKEFTSIKSVNSFSLKADMSPVKNQMDASTCTSFGVIAILDYEYRGLGLTMSEAHLTHIAEKKYGDCIGGLSIGQAMLSCKAPGIVPERYWPYDPTQICWENPPNIDQYIKAYFQDIKTLYNRPRSEVIDVMKSQLKPDLLFRNTFYDVDDDIPSKIKAVLHGSRRPLVVSVPVWFKSSGYFDAGWDWGPHVQMPNPVQVKLWLQENVDKALASSNEDGWHAIAICGYDNSNARFEFKNSWGSFWGEGGYGTIPYEYISEYSDIGMHGWL